MSGDPRPKESPQGECGGNQATCGLDGCPKFGTLRANGRIRGCGDISARNGRNRSKGLRKQRKARQALGIPDALFAGMHTNEETWAGSLRVEVKAGAQIKAAWTAYLRQELQSEAARPIGDTRPFVAIAMPDGMSDGLVMFRLSNLEQVIVGFLETWEQQEP